MSGARHCRKGARIERELVERHYYKTPMPGGFDGYRSGVIQRGKERMRWVGGPVVVLDVFAIATATGTDDANRPTLNIARHGATAQGSTRELIHQWQINLDEKTVEYTAIGHRQIAPKLTDAELIRKAISVSEAIKAAPRSNFNSDFQLTWISSTECRIRPSALIPGRTPKQTVAGRRRRMREILQQQVKAIGWVQDQRGSWITFTKADTSA